ncbi:hypothetical protein F8388_022995 [Cannabis sativa]|uniref:CCHC-type domain-containing protein n=1 Tax=Cannabis sativa TaxID=3483 RepID=A0A7J6GUC5_CANSA|nr:hypothetical protein F8388_022995 [Cannabis sativa]KAF4386556.1 hypothetical protein G4B88_006812 [Cannabis sativa]
MVTGERPVDVDELVNMTSKLGVDHEEEWEENEDAAIAFGAKSLVGKLISHRNIRENLFTTIFNRMWKGIAEWTVKMNDDDGEEKLVRVTFKSVEDAKSVLGKQPWLFNGGLLILEKWPLSEKCDSNRRNGRGSGGDPLGRENRMFLNGYVRMRIGFPLNASIFVGRFIPCGGKKHWIQFKFEHLPMLYFNCGIWGHEQKDCTSGMLRETDAAGNLVPKYGSWLKDDDPCPNGFVSAGVVNSIPHINEVGHGGLERSPGNENGVHGGPASHGGLSSAEEEEQTVMRSVGEGKSKPQLLDKKKRKNGGATVAIDSEEVQRLRSKGKQVQQVPVGADGNENFAIGVSIDEPRGPASSSGQRKRVYIKMRARLAKNNGDSRGKTVSELEKSQVNGGGSGDVSLVVESLKEGSHGGLGLGEKKVQLFVSELSRSQAQRLSATLQFGENFWSVDRVGLSGGLLLMWKEEVTVRVDSSSPGHILAMIAGKDFLPWALTCFYGNPEASQRKFSWELLRNISREVQGAWLCIGDFNEIVSLAEKVGGRIKSAGAMEEFREVINDCRLIDFSSSKTDLTWCNEHESNPIMERLDRGLCNDESLQCFAGADIKVLDWWASDHRPLVVEMPLGNDSQGEEHGRKKGRFHFEEAWCEEDQWKDIIEEQ